MGTSSAYHFVYTMDGGITDYNGFNAPGGLKLVNVYKAQYPEGANACKRL